ncbi:MAG: MtnX-like HAD-IB family phosphatase [Candidatus Heimdallarchaeota archaeon]
MNLAVLCDFDGTVVNIDTAEFILENFTNENWQQFDTQLEKGEITLEECMQKQYAMIKTPKAELLKRLEQVTTFRPHFNKFVFFCQKRDIPLTIVSAGLDFCIEHFLTLNGWNNLIKVYSAETRFTDNGFELIFPKMIDKISKDFKADLINFYQQQYKRVIYIGDGLSDYNAVRQANFSFVVKGTKLVDLCKREKIAHQEIEDFQEILESLEHSLEVGLT